MPLYLIFRVRSPLGLPTESYGTPKSREHPIQVSRRTCARKVGFCPLFEDAYLLFPAPSAGLVREVAAIATFGGKSFLDPM